MRIPTLTIALLLAGAGAAVAQETTDDWEILREPDQKVIFAYVPTTTGLTIGFRCHDGVFGSIIGGLPPASRGAKTRTLRIKARDGQFNDWRWNVTTDRTVAMADYPAPLARLMREGGAISVVIPGGADGSRNLRHDLELPASTVAIDETLNACGRPLEDPRDALLPEVGEGGLPDGVTWARPPRPTYPKNNYAQGFAVVTCLAGPDGALDQCEVESEFPTDGGFGRAAVRGAGNARVLSPNETPGAYIPRRIGFRVNFVQG